MKYRGFTAIERKSCEYHSRAQDATTVLLSRTRVTGELTEIERLTVSSERGGWKSAIR